VTSTVSAALAQSGLVPLDAQVLLAHVVGKDRAWLVAHGAMHRPRALDAFLALARAAADGEPVAYLTGTREFWGLALVARPPC
jgi:release factor glutamine methyltransferase